MTRQKATQFSFGEAAYFINNQIPKKKRGIYSVEEISPPPEFFITLAPPKIHYGKQPKKDVHTEDIGKIREKVVRLSNVNMERFSAEINDLAEELRARLAHIDNEILDYRHWIRDKATSLNALEGYRAYMLHTELERKREELKKTFRLCELLMQKAEEIKSIAEDYDYEPYKPRTDMDFDKLIKGENELIE